MTPEEMFRRALQCAKRGEDLIRNTSTEISEARAMAAQASARLADFWLQAAQVSRENGWQ